MGFGPSWAYAIVILASLTYLVGVLRFYEDAGGAHLRVLSALGLLASAAGIFLGGIWPSAYTPVTILMIPALFIFIFAAVRPAAVWRRRGLRLYLHFCVFAAGLMWMFASFMLRSNVISDCPSLKGHVEDMDQRAD